MAVPHPQLPPTRSWAKLTLGIFSVFTIHAKQKENNYLWAASFATYEKFQNFGNNISDPSYNQDMRSKAK